MLPGRFATVDGRNFTLTVVIIFLFKNWCLIFSENLRNSLEVVKFFQKFFATSFRHASNVQRINFHFPEEIRERLEVEQKNYTMVSRIIKNGIDSNLIEEADRKTDLCTMTKCGNLKTLIFNVYCGG